MPTAVNNSGISIKGQQTIFTALLAPGYNLVINLPNTSTFTSPRFGWAYLLWNPTGASRYYIAESRLLTGNGVAFRQPSVPLSGGQNYRLAIAWNFDAIAWQTQHWIP